jgi:hypothetical protein
MASVARNDLESAVAQLKNAFGEQDQIEIRGINLPIPQWIFEKPKALTIPVYRPHPFIYGRPVRASEFLNREDELRPIVGRLGNGESPPRNRASSLFAASHGRFNGREHGR